MGDCGYVKHVGDDLKAAGVDVAIVDWINFYSGEQKRVETILQCIEMPVAIMVDAEPAWTGSTWSDIQSRINTTIGWYARRTDLYPNYYRDPVTQFPLVMVWDPGGVASINEWNGYLNWIKGNTPEHGIFVAGLGANTPVTSFPQESLFDGYLAENGAASASQQLSDIQWALYNLSRGEFLVSNAIPDYNEAANCGSEPSVVPRTMNHFDGSWSNVINASSNGNRVHSAYVSYHNDGEDIGIEPAKYSSPMRGSGFNSCSGVLSANYQNYGSVTGMDYISRNLTWANEFKGSR
jgi:hypothetical protein